jgi:hypothetical protein
VRMLAIEHTNIPFGPNPDAILRNPNVHGKRLEKIPALLNNVLPQCTKQQASSSPSHAMRASQHVCLRCGVAAGCDRE